jgi:hypothetical protein
VSIKRGDGEQGTMRIRGRKGNRGINSKTRKAKEKNASRKHID